MFPQFLFLAGASLAQTLVNGLCLQTLWTLSSLLIFWSDIVPLWCYGDLTYLYLSFGVILIFW
jgi:hypothetical protein